MAEIPTIDVYKSIREEVIEQKKCQFQILTAAVTFTAAAWAFVSHGPHSSLGYLAPIALDVGALVMILDKAKSIQRMVGYLQVMEEKSGTDWKWELNLDKFRGLPEKIPKERGQAAAPNAAGKAGSHPSDKLADARKHSYIRTVGILLLALSAFCVLFYALTLVPEVGAAQSQAAATSGEVVSVLVKLLVLGLGLATTIFGLTRFVHVRRQLTTGIYSSSEIRKRWKDVTGQGS